MKGLTDCAARLLVEDETATRTERLYERMKQMILSDLIHAGYTFPNEIEMCQELKISRGTLREAYRLLLADELITRSKMGTTVNTKEEIIRSAPFTIAAQYAEFKEVFEFRLMLETENVRYAAAHITQGELGQMQAILKESADTHSVEVRQQLDWRFHEAVADASHNPLLINIFHAVKGTFQSLMAANYLTLGVHSPQTLRDAVGQHCRICGALEERDPEKACALMREHLVSVYAEKLK